jgi:hypothetical protein
MKKIGIALISITFLSTLSACGSDNDFTISLNQPIEAGEINYKEFPDILAKNNCLTSNVESYIESNSDTETTEFDNKKDYPMSVNYSVSYKGLNDINLKKVNNSQAENENGNDVFKTELAVIYYCTRSEYNIRSKYLYPEFYSPIEDESKVYGPTDLVEVKQKPIKDIFYD